MLADVGAGRPYHGAGEPKEQTAQAGNHQPGDTLKLLVPTPAV